MHNNSSPMSYTYVIGDQERLWVININLSISFIFGSSENLRITQFHFLLTSFRNYSCDIKKKNSIILIIPRQWIRCVYLSRRFILQFSFSLRITILSMSSKCKAGRFLSSLIGYILILTLSDSANKPWIYYNIIVSR